MAVFSGLLAAAAGTAGAAGATAGTAGAATGLAGAAGAIGTLGGLVGTGLQVAGTMQANKEAEKQAELQRTQMNLEAQRNRKRIIRESLVARSEALSNATAQGAQQSSGLAGGQAQISQQAGINVLGETQAQGIGNAMFDSKAREARAQTLASIGSGISSLGGSLVSNQEAIGRLGTYYGSVG